MSRQWWNERFIDRRNWILEHLDNLSLTSEEALLVLMIDYMNEFAMPITHHTLAVKLKKNDDEIDDVLSRLSTKGFIHLQLLNGKIQFQIDGVFEGNQETIPLDMSIFDQFETEFGRPLSPIEMQRLADWTNQYQQKLMVYALREALTYDKKSFDYIERILIEWKNKGLTPEDYEEGKR